MAHSKKRSAGSAQRAQARQAASAKYAPVEFALVQALRQAAGDRAQAQATARGVGDQVAGLAEGAVPAAQRVFAGQRAQFEDARSRIPAAVGPVDGAAAGVIAGSQRDFALAQAQQAAQQQRTLGELLSRAQDARAGALQGVLQAENRYGSAVGDIRAKALDVAGQKGEYAAGLLLQLQAAQQKLDHENAAQQRQFAQQNSAREDQQSFTAGENQKNRDARANDKKKEKGTLPGGVKRATPKQEGDAKDSIGRAVTYAKQLKAGGRSMQETGATLKKGRESQTIETGKTTKNALGKEVPEKVKVPGIPATGTLWAQVAAQTAYWGGITSNTAKDLHRRGLSYRALGLRIVKKPAPSGAVGVGGPVTGKIG